MYFLCKITEGGKLRVWVQNDFRVEAFLFLLIKMKGQSKILNLELRIQGCKRRLGEKK